MFQGAGYSFSETEEPRGKQRLVRVKTQIENTRGGQQQAQELKEVTRSQMFMRGGKQTNIINVNSAVNGLVWWWRLFVSMPQNEI